MIINRMCKYGIQRLYSIRYQCDSGVAVGDGDRRMLRHAGHWTHGRRFIWDQCGSRTSGTSLTATAGDAQEVRSSPSIHIRIVSMGRREPNYDEREWVWISRVTRVQWRDCFGQSLRTNSHHGWKGELAWVKRFVCARKINKR